MIWQQVYDPLGNSPLSTLAAFLPAVLLLACLGGLRMKAHLAALVGLGAALGVALFIYHMPVRMAAGSALFGAAYGFLPVGWIILNVLFLFRLTEQKGLFRVLQASLTQVTSDRRLQLLLVAFCFGAFLEGAAGFGTPVAVSGSILVGLGFPPIQAAVLSMIANTAPVPYAGLGTPLVALQAVTGLDLRALTLQTALQMSLFDLLIPFLLVLVFCGRRGVRGVWPALLVTGASFAGAQLLVAWLHGPWLVNIISALASMGALMLFLRVWRPKDAWAMEDQAVVAARSTYPRAEVTKAWLPWGILSGWVFVWGLPQVRVFLDGFSRLNITIPGLDGLVLRMPPLVGQAQPQAAVFELAWLSASGTAILLAAVVAGWWMRFSPRELWKHYAATLRQARFSLLTISAMMAIGFVARYAGMDGTMGLAFARSGPLYPFFGALLGWLGVVITGSDTSSNVLFGSLQRITAQQLGFDPVTMAAANTSGGVMGKMINAQGIVVAATAVNQPGAEGLILRRLAGYSLGLAALVGLVVMGIAYCG